MASATSTNIPLHVGIIMDGNGRWAKANGKPRTFGHSEGLKAAKNAVSFALKSNIKYLTLYTFSTENWKRAKSEVGFLFSLISKHLKNEMDFYKQNKIQVRVCGDISALPKNLQNEIEEVIFATKDFNNLTVILAINYGGRDEIVRAVKKIAATIKTKNEDFDIDAFIGENLINNSLDNPDVPDVDLIIRSAGEQRLSNFLIWQAAYSEYYFTKTLWPDFDDNEFALALEAYKNRDRKFGDVKEESEINKTI